MPTALAIREGKVRSRISSYAHDAQNQRQLWPGSFATEAQAALAHDLITLLTARSPVLNFVSSADGVSPYQAELDDVDCVRPFSVPAVPPDSRTPTRALTVRSFFRLARLIQIHFVCLVVTSFAGAGQGLGLRLSNTHLSTAIHSSPHLS